MNKLIFIKKKSILLVLLCVFLALTACKEDIPEIIKEDFTKIIISKDVVEIDDKTWKENFIKVDSLDYTLTFSDKSETIKKIVPGNIIVSGLGNGLMRRVSSIRHSTSQIVFITTQAVVTDIITQGSIQYKQILVPTLNKSVQINNNTVILNDPKLKNSTNSKNINIGFNENFPVGQVTLNGDFNCDFNLDANIDIRFSGLKEVKFGFVASENLSLKFIAGTSFSSPNEDLQNKEKTIWTYNDIPTMRVSLLVFKPILYLKIGYHGTTDKSFQVEYEQKFKYNSGIQWYNTTGWNKYGAYTNTQTFSGPVTDQTIPTGNVIAYIKPEIVVKINNLIGPYANLKLYGRVEGNGIQIPQTTPPNYKIHKGMSLGAGVRVDVLSWHWSYDVTNILNYEDECYNFTAPALPQYPPTVSKVQVKKVTLDSATISWEIPRLGTSPLIARGICWSTSENPTVNDYKVNEGTEAGAFISSIYNLLPNTKYYVRAYAVLSPYMNNGYTPTNIANTIYGIGVSFTTPAGIFIDPRDNNKYVYANIGTQTWMVENLAYLPEVSPSANNNKTLPRYYVFGFEGENVLNAKATPNYKKSGVLYNYPAALTACPAGWHLPTDAEWKTLEMNLGMSQTAADNSGIRVLGEVGRKLKTSYDWGLSGDNSSGFMALQGGMLGEQGYNLTDAWFWTSSLSSSQDTDHILYPWYRSLGSNSWGVNREKINPRNGMSVRCIKNIQAYIDL
jgi:uncharacterized protein (TIGR02145 family)